MISHAKMLWLAAFGVLVVAFVSCGASSQRSEPVQVAGIAMEPAIKKGDRILVTTDVRNLKRGDIVTYYYPFDETQRFISRIVALPNEEIEIRDGNVFIDGNQLTETYVASENSRALSNRAKTRIPVDRFFVLGDNRDNSNDSRAWGPLQKKFIYGKFLRKY